MVVQRYVRMAWLSWTMSIVAATVSFVLRHPAYGLSFYMVGRSPCSVLALTLLLLFRVYKRLPPIPTKAACSSRQHC